MCSEKNHRDYYTITTYKANTFKDEIKRKSLRDIFVYHFVFYICLFVAEIFFYFKGRNSCREKVSPFSPILDKFAKVWPAKNIFVNISKRLSHEKWTSKAKLDENWNKLTWTCLKVITPTYKFYKHPSKHLLVLKTSWRRLEHVFSVTIFWLPRRLEDVLQRRRLEDISQDVLEDERFLCWRRLQDILKACLEDVLTTCLEDVLKACLEDILKTSWRQKKDGDICI